MSAGGTSALAHPGEQGLERMAVSMVFDRMRTIFLQAGPIENPCSGSGRNDGLEIHLAGSGQ